jgi:TRAP-type C4-dicarboxylate transport system permease small subunit
MRERLIAVIYVVAACLLAAAVAMMTVQVAFRTLFAAPFSWVEEISRYAFVWCVYLGSIIAVAHGTHIRVLVLVERFGQRGARFSDALTWVINLIVFGYLFYWSADLAWKYKDATFYTLPDMPQVLFYLALPVSTGITLLLLVSDRARTADPAEPPPPVA